MCSWDLRYPGNITDDEYIRGGHSDVWNLRACVWLVGAHSSQFIYYSNCYSFYLSIRFTEYEVWSIHISQKKNTFSYLWTSFMKRILFITVRVLWNETTSMLKWPWISLLMKKYIFSAQLNLIALYRVERTFNLYNTLVQCTIIQDKVFPSRSLLRPSSELITNWRGYTDFFSVQPRTFQHSTLHMHTLFSVMLKIAKSHDVSPVSK